MEIMKEKETVKCERCKRGEIQFIQFGYGTIGICSNCRQIIDGKNYIKEKIK